MHDILLKEIMTKPAVTVHVGDPFSFVEKQMREKKVRHIPVIDNHKFVVGLISQRDLYRILSPRKTSEGDVYDAAYLDGFILSNVMTTEVQTLTEFSALKDAVALMVNQRLGCVPIIDKDQRISGILTKGDVLRFLDKAFGSAEGHV